MMNFVYDLLHKLLNKLRTRILGNKKISKLGGDTGYCSVLCKGRYQNVLLFPILLNFLTFSQVLPMTFVYKSKFLLINRPVSFKP